ncbi:DUF6879 family protein [Nocardia sp. R16R-3T]
MFDDAVLAYTIFELSGRWAGGAVTTDPRLVEYCRTVKERVWALATPGHARARSGRGPDRAPNWRLRAHSGINVHVSQRFVENALAPAAMLRSAVPCRSRWR